MVKQKIKGVVINPEASEKTSIIKTQELFKIWWELEVDKNKDNIRREE